MNKKKFEEAKAILRNDIHANGYKFYYDDLPIEYQLRWLKLSCIDRINSLLCYECREYKNAKDVLEYDIHHSRHSYLQEYAEHMGEGAVLELIQEQINDIEKIDTDCFVDDE